MSDTEKKVDPKSVSIRYLGLELAMLNCLMADGIHTVHDLLQKTEREIMKIPGLGRTRINTLKSRLTELGLELKPKAT